MVQKEQVESGLRQVPIIRLQPDLMIYSSRAVKFTTARIQDYLRIILPAVVITPEAQDGSKDVFPMSVFAIIRFITYPKML